MTHKNFSTLEISEMAGVHRVTVRRWLHSGKLKGFKAGGKLLIPEKEWTLFLRPLGSTHRQVVG